MILLFTNVCYLEFSKRNESLFFWQIFINLFVRKIFVIFDDYTKRLIDDQRKS